MDNFQKFGELGSVVLPTAILYHLLWAMISKMVLGRSRLNVSPKIKKKNTRKLIYEWLN